MVKRSFLKKINKRPDSEPVSVGEFIFTLLETMGGSRERARLNELWTNWAEVLGEDLAALASPMGYHGTVLLIGADDAMAIQELSLQAEEILERVNGFLKKEYFVKIKFQLNGAV